ncbi:hypothetical protein GCM10011369_03170 [Neiella marina]|uniref:Gfo/Idh/MocA-like oxidoreductase N-terminal domain-containing protein n=1 Tax=Neiella marina TaxID=508461 RepID=A0A8J2U201_9GAMM|nr:Gfo/Idh/MocA family oxidoreductase [Neiella marina]GGA65124.1 hypothetical protein GCM10011369_03170 [Neiella marina]
MSSIETAAIIGTHWGLVHLPTLQSQGITITALVSKDLPRAKQVATDHQIAMVTDQLEQIGQPDLVIVATPAVTHAAVIQAFPNSHIFCEKPVVGPYGNPADLPAWADRVLINYAFNQLDSARCVMAQHLIPTHIQLQSSVNLSGFNFDAVQWFFEVTSHPLSWLIHWLGPPTLEQRRIDRDQIELRLRCGDTSIDIDFKVGGKPGIHHQFDMATASGSLTLNGYYQPGHPWRFEPVVLAQKPLNQGEFIDNDCWLRANQRSLLLALDCFNGRLSRAEAICQGAFSLSKALTIESLFEKKPGA